MKFLLLVMAALVFAVSCSAKKYSQEEFCEEMPKAVCAKLFDASCENPYLESDGARYKDKSECETEEKKICVEFTELKYAFNEEEAHNCINQIEKADCARAIRAQFHSCNKVFTLPDTDAGHPPSPITGDEEEEEEREDSGETDDETK